MGNIITDSASQWLSTDTAGVLADIKRLGLQEAAEYNRNLMADDIETQRLGIDLPSVEDFVAALTELAAEHTEYECVSDRYEPGVNPDVYATVHAFLHMCRQVWGEAPELHQIGTEWHDDQGLVLREVAS